MKTASLNRPKSCAGSESVCVWNVKGTGYEKVFFSWCLQMGKKNRSVGATLMNQDSSRSHSIFSITVETSAGPCSEHPDTEKSVIRVGKLNLVSTPISKVCMKIFIYVFLILTVQMSRKYPSSIFNFCEFGKSWIFFRRNQLPFSRMYWRHLRTMWHTVNLWSTG